MDSEDVLPPTCFPTTDVTYLLLHNFYSVYKKWDNPVFERKILDGTVDRSYHPNPKNYRELLKEYFEEDPGRIKNANTVLRGAFRLFSVYFTTDPEMDFYVDFDGLVMPDHKDPSMSGSLLDVFKSKYPKEELRYPDLPWWKTKDVSHYKDMYEIPWWKSMNDAYYPLEKVFYRAVTEAEEDDSETEASY